MIKMNYNKDRLYNLRLFSQLGMTGNIENGISVDS